MKYFHNIEPINQDYTFLEGYNSALQVFTKEEINYYIFTTIPDVIDYTNIDSNIKCIAVDRSLFKVICNISNIVYISDNKYELDINYDPPRSQSFIKGDVVTDGFSGKSYVVDHIDGLMIDNIIDEKGNIISGRCVRKK